MFDVASGLPRLDEAILVVGADGMLGSRLVKAFEQRGLRVWGSTRNRDTVGGKRVHLDLSDDIENFHLPFAGGGAAILCAAHTSIDLCQREPRATRRINVDNMLALAQMLTDAGVFVVFLSSNAVFDGRTAFAGSSDTRHPLHEYGRQKADAETQLMSMNKPVAMIRFSKVIAPDMPLLSGWVRQLQSGEAVYPFEDAVMAPISAGFAVEVASHVARAKHPGVIQASASDDISYASAAKYLATRIGADTNLIKPTSSKGVGTAFFPSHTTLDTTELAKLGFETPLPKEAIDQFLDTTHGGPVTARK